MPIFAGLTALITAGTENKRVVSIRFVDASGDKRAVSFPITAGALYTDIAAMVSTFAQLTQAVIWSVEVTEIFGVIPSNGGAGTDANNSVFDNVVVNFKSGTTGVATDLFIPAPIESLILEGDVVDTSNADFDQLVSSDIGAVSNIGTPLTARFTERREINPRVTI